MTTTTSTLISLFHSLATLRAEHLELLKRFREAGEDPQYAGQIKDFIERSVASGVYLDRDDDRQSAQSVLDYWGSRLYRLTQENIDNVLLDFDPSLAPELPGALCPYLGLSAFNETNSKLFFGRQRLVAALVEQIKNQRILIVVGPSGSGKSSVVKAGLLPALKACDFPETTWTYLPTIFPGERPLDSLNQVLQDAPAAGLIVIVDQFEEVFTLSLDEQNRADFIQKLLDLSRDRLGHRVILTLRTDYEPQMMRLGELNNEQNYAHLPPLNASELREAIEAPANPVGLRFDDGVVNSLLNDILGEPAALPLLQFTLLRLWENRERNRITASAYRRLGGGRMALAKSADEFYERLMPEQKEVARQILLRLVRPAAGLEVTSNRMSRQDLYRKGYAHDRQDLVVKKFVEEAHLLRLSPGKTPAEDQIEVAHEALIRNWPTLVDWLDHAREQLRERRRLSADAEQWQKRDRDAAALLRGAILQEAAGYDDLTALESAFVQASRAAEQAEQAVIEALREREQLDVQLNKKIARDAVLLALSSIIFLISTLMGVIVPFTSFISGIAICAILTFAGRILSLSFMNTGVMQGFLAFIERHAPFLLPPKDYQEVDATISSPERMKSAGLYLIPFYLLVVLFGWKTSTKLERFSAVQALILYIANAFFFFLVLSLTLGHSVIGALFVFVLFLITMLMVPYFAIKAYLRSYARIPFVGNIILRWLG